jgi:aerobic C4-dicarboxylate transport protein
MTTENSIETSFAPLPPPPTESKGQPFYLTLWFQVLVAMVLAVVFGHFSPTRAVAMKPLGDAFIRLISMVFTLIIF